MLKSISHSLRQVAQQLQKSWLQLTGPHFELKDSIQFTSISSGHHVGTQKSTPLKTPEWTWAFGIEFTASQQW